MASLAPVVAADERCAEIETPVACAIPGQREHAVSADTAAVRALLAAVCAQVRAAEGAIVLTHPVQALIAAYGEGWPWCIEAVTAPHMQSLLRPGVPVVLDAEEPRAPVPGIDTSRLLRGMRTAMLVALHDKSADVRAVLWLAGSLAKRCFDSQDRRTVACFAPALIQVMRLGRVQAEMGRRVYGTEQCLQATRSINAHLIQNLSLAVAVYDRSYNVVFANRKCRDLLDLQEDAHLLTSLKVLGLDAGYQDWRAQLQAVIEQGKQGCIEEMAIGREGEPHRIVRLCSSPIRVADGQIHAGLLTVEDMTERASLEKRLAVSERLATLGKLAAHVAHELNNPLDGVTRYVKLASRICQNEPADQKRVHTYLEAGSRGLMRMGHIIRELLDFSRSTQVPVEPAPVHSLLEEAMATVCHGNVAAGVHVTSESPEEPCAWVPGTMFQVFCNLLKNALEAMPDGGRLEVKAWSEDGLVVAQVRDTGPGIAHEDAARVFDPFFTTKGPGKGTGLGLAICRDLVQKAGGEISASNHPDGGAVFRVAVPSVDDSQRTGLPRDT